MDELLTPDTVAAYLVGRGVATDVRDVEPLGGGVSNVVLAVVADGRDLVVKQALPRLAVADEWLAKRERALTEAAAIDLCAAMTPGAVPAVVDVDAEACALVIERAERSWSDWKSRLLSGDADVAVAAALGAVLARWHTGSRGRDVLERFDDPEAFEQLRVDPYHRTVMRRRPQLADAIGAHVDRMLATRACLVHGDFSPKNVLVGRHGGADVWVVDFEVAHAGDPVFDVAFMLNHLLLKAIHRPADASAFADCGRAFADSYRAGTDGALDVHGSYLAGHVGCLMVARVVGKSPAEYLTTEGRRRALALGTRLVTDPPGDVAEAWNELVEVRA